MFALHYKSRICDRTPPYLETYLVQFIQNFKICEF